MSKRDEKFQEWSTGPEALRISQVTYGPEPGSTDKMIAALMRSAFDSGFDACLAEVRDRLRELARDSVKTQSAARTATASPSRPRKPL